LPTHLVSSVANQFRSTRLTNFSVFLVTAAKPEI